MFATMGPMAGTPRKERLLNLVTLLVQPSARTLAEITRVVPGYSNDHTNARAEFHRDKRQLGENGFPVETLERSNATMPDGSDRYGYRILPERSELPEFGLTDAEALAIRHALTTVALSGEADTYALWKLGGSDPLADLPIGDLDAPAVLGDLLNAIAAAAEVSFMYHGRPHQVRPHGLLMRRARWYLSGELIGDQRRTYRVDRLSDLSVGAPGAFVPPESWDPDQVLPSEPWTIGGDDPVAVEVAVTGPLARWVEASLRPGSVIAELPDGVVVRLAVSFPDAFRTWLLGLGSDATVLGPEPMVEIVRSWLHDIAVAPGTATETEISTASTAAAGPPRAPETRATPAVRWIRRTLAMLTGLSQQDGPVAFVDLAERFGTTVDQVIEDLDLASCCGVPPYGPEDLFEIVVDIDDGTAEMSAIPVLQPRGPGELTSDEIVAVSTAGQVLLDVIEPRDRDVLAAAVHKVTTVLGTGRHLRVVLDSPPHVAVLRSAVTCNLTVAIDYYAATSARISEDRLVDPYDVSMEKGRWYMDAWDHASNRVRRFRVDRVLSVDPTDVVFERRVAEPNEWPPPGSPSVVVRAPAVARWVGETHPVTITDDEDGTIRIILGVADVDWLSTLLLQIGPGVQVLSPGELVSLPIDAATKLLARYQHVTGA
jgi:predicted DNA-binding transcriptional regulator YafY